MHIHEAGAMHADAGRRDPEWLREPGDVNALLPILWTRNTRRDPSAGVLVGASVDGGMSDDIRAMLYHAAYSCTLASRRSDARPVLARVVGKHCESGDIVVRDEFLPADIAPGDLLAVPGTGAYCRSMANNYNHVPRPPVIAVRDGSARVIMRRETKDDLLRLDV
jgi:diaminopimelate decarboxylase